MKILVLVNDADWELCGGIEYEMQVPVFPTRYFSLSLSLSLSPLSFSLSLSLSLSLPPSLPPSLPLWLCFCLRLSPHHSLLQLSFKKYPQLVHYCTYRTMTRFASFLRCMADNKSMLHGVVSRLPSWLLSCIYPMGLHVSIYVMHVSRVCVCVFVFVCYSVRENQEPTKF